MFKKFRESAYCKAAMVMLICGAILIVFNNWISKAKLSMSIDAVMDTITPVFVGVMLAFLMCPIYNRIVKTLYSNLVKKSVINSAQVGTRVIYSDKERELNGDERRRYLQLSRAAASIACLIIVIGLITMMIYTIVPQVVNSCVELIDTLPERLAALSSWLSANFPRFPMLATWVDNVASAGVDKVVGWLQQHVIGGDAASIAQAISTGLINAVSFIIDIIIGILIMVYLLNYKEKLFAICRKFIAATCKSRTQDGLYEFSDILNETFIGYLVGRIIDSFIIGVMTYVVLLVCGISFAPMISVIVGVTNVIPFFGPFIGAIPSFLILMLESPIQALWFVVIILIIQQLDGNVIGPKIVGNAIGIDSFWVLIAVIISGGLFGFMGMLFGVPVFAVIYRYVDKLTTRSLRRKDKAMHTSDYFTLEQLGVNTEDINLENSKKNEKNFLSRFKKTSSEDAVEKLFDPETMNEEPELARELSVKMKRREYEDLEAIKEQIAKELLDNDK